METAVAPHFINIENRDEFPLFVPSPTEEFRVSRMITEVAIKPISFDDEYAELKKKGKQIDIRSAELFVNGRKPMDGIFSPLFGADSTQDTPVFTCDCGELTGGSNKGRICKKCESECRTIEADLRTRGYIDIAPYHVLTHLGYTAMARVVKNLDDIITKTKRINRSGKTVDDGLPTIMDLYDDYEELYEEKCGWEKKYAWTSKIPVFTSRLRPLIQSHVTMSILDVNKRYLSIVTLANILKGRNFIPSKSPEIEVQRTLNQIQKECLEVYKIGADQANSKKGVFRQALTSGRMDYSARMVIALGDDLMAHEIDVPYQVMMIEYEEEICHYLMELEDIPLTKAISKVERHILKPSKKFINIINILIRSGVGLWTIVNRNPTITKHSVIYCRIRRVHDDPNDYTLHLPPDVLKGLGADFSKDLYYNYTDLIGVGMAAMSYKKFRERLTSGVGVSRLTVEAK